MRWRRGHQSSNVDDRRGQGGGGGGGGLPIMALASLLPRLGLPGLLLVLFDGSTPNARPVAR